MILKKELTVSIAGFFAGIIYYFISKFSGDTNPFYQSQLGILVAVISTIAILIILYVNYKQK